MYQAEAEEVEWTALTRADGCTLWLRDGDMALGVTFTPDSEPGDPGFYEVHRGTPIQIFRLNEGIGIWVTVIRDDGIQEMHPITSAVMTALVLEGGLTVRCEDMRSHTWEGEDDEDE